jgi:hypothetical protein
MLRAEHWLLRSPLAPPYAGATQLPTWAASANARHAGLTLSYEHGPHSEQRQEHYGHS